MPTNADIVVVGAGIVGLAVAFQLARRAPLKIIVVDKGAGPGAGSTGASSAVCRHRYSRSEMVRLARDGIFAYRHWSEFLEIRQPLARFHNHGVLWLAAATHTWDSTETERLHALGVRTVLLDDNELSARFPALNACVIAPDLHTGEPHHCRGGGSHMFELDAGYVDPQDALQDLITAAKTRGVDIRFRSKVEDIRIKNGRVASVCLGNGTLVGCQHVINAAGPWCEEVFSAVGLACSWPLKPTRIQIAVIDRPAAVVGPVPVCCDLSGGIYFRTENRGRQIVVGSILEQDEQEEISNPDGFDAFADDDFLRSKQHALAHRIPELLQHRIRGYSGLYTINRRDMHPIVGSTPIGGFWVANGCSGHGFKLAPAIGSLLSQQILGVRTEFDTDVEKEFLAYDRTPISLPTKSVLA